MLLEQRRATILFPPPGARKQRAGHTPSDLVGIAQATIETPGPDRLEVHQVADLIAARVRLSTCATGVRM